MIRLAVAFSMLLGFTAVSTGADDAEQKKPRFGGKFDPEKAKQFQERFKNLDPEKLKEIQAKLKEKGIDIEAFKDPEKRKELLEKFKGKGGDFKGKFDPEKLKELREKFKGKGGDFKGKGGFKGKGKPEKTE